MLHEGVPEEMVSWLSHTTTMLLLSGPWCSIGSGVTMNLGNWNGTIRGVINSLPFTFSTVFRLSKVEWYGFMFVLLLQRRDLVNTDRLYPLGT